MPVVQTSALLRHIRRLSREAAPLSDRQLLERFIADNDEAAFAEMIGRHGALVLDVCRRTLWREQDAEDAFQATFLVLARKAASIKKTESLASWLYGVAWRSAARLRADLAQRRNHERNTARSRDRATARAAVEEPPDQSWREVQEALREELARLPERYRAPLVLCYLEGQTQCEAARQLGCGQGVLHGRLDRARERLRQQLIRRGITLSVALLAAGVTSESPASAALIQATARLAGGSASAAITALANAVCRGLLVARVKVLASVLLATAVLAACGYRLAVVSEPGQEVTRVAGAKPVDDGPKPPVDLHGDPLPPGAVARLGTLRFRHRAPVSGAAYSPDGKLLATAGTVDRQVRLWEAKTGRLLASIPGNGTVVFTHNGQRLYYCGGNTKAEAKFLNVPGLREEESSIYAVNSRCLALSPDGRCLAWDMGDNKSMNEVWVCDASTGKERFRLTDHQKPVSCVAYSSDGKTMTTTGDEAVIRLWDAATGKLLLRLDGHKPVDGYQGNMLAVAFSPDGKRLVSGGIDKTVRLWDIANGKELRRFGEHKGGVLCVAFTPDGKQALTGGFDEPIRLWDAATGKEVRQFPKRSKSASRIAFAPGGKTMAVAHWGNYAPRFWDLAGGREVALASGPESEVTSIVFSRDGRTLTTAGYDGVIRHWDTNTGRELRRWENMPILLSCLASSPDGQIIAGGDDDGIIGLWQAGTGQELRRLQGPKGWVQDLAFAPDGKMLASAGNDGSVSLWDMATGAELRRLKSHKRYARGVAFTPDGKTLATTAEDATVRLWRVDTGEEQRRLETANQQNNAVAISPDGRLLLVASQGERPIQVWDLATGRELAPFTLPHDHQRIFSLAFSPDGRTLATGGEDGVVRVWEMASSQERRRFTGHTGWAYRVRFAPDGQRLASVSNDTTGVVWDLITPSADERKLAAGMTEEQAKKLWDDLAGDAGQAHRAIRVLAAAPARSVPLLRGKLTPIAKIDPEQVKKLIAQLESEEFAARERATKELEKLGDAVSAACRQALEGNPSPELRRRLEKLLGQIWSPSPDHLRTLRSLEVLELAATQDAQQLLQKLAKGAPEARLTRDAKAALQRLDQR